MKTITTLKHVTLIAILLSLGFSVIQRCVALPSACPKIQVCFTPGGNCTSQIDQHILHAKTSILVQAYEFTSQPIADALVAAKKIGVVVKVILDKSQLKSKSSRLNFIYDAGIPVWIDTKPKIAHNKILIIDGQYVMTGSFNFTNSAQKRNAENIVFILDPLLAKQYTENWETRQAASVLYPISDEVFSPGVW